MCKGSSVNSWFDSNNVETQVSSNGATKDEKAYVELKISEGPLVNAKLLAHWGAIKAGKRYWNRNFRLKLGPVTIAKPALLRWTAF